MIHIPLVDDAAIPKRSSINYYGTGIFSILEGKYIHRKENGSPRRVSGLPKKETFGSRFFQGLEFSAP
jgi:hypothetical protein